MNKRNNNVKKSCVSFLKIRTSIKTYPDLFLIVVLQTVNYTLRLKVIMKYQMLRVLSQSSMLGIHWPWRPHTDTVELLPLDRRSFPEHVMLTAVRSLISVVLTTCSTIGKHSISEYQRFIHFQTHLAHVRRNSLVITVHPLQFFKYLRFLPKCYLKVVLIILWLKGERTELNLTIFYRIHSFLGCNLLYSYIWSNSKSPLK